MPTWCCYTDTATTKSTAESANDNGPRAEKPDEVKVSRPVWEWRWDG